MTRLPPAIAALLPAPDAAPVVDRPRPGAAAAQGFDAGATFDLDRFLQEGPASLRAPPVAVPVPGAAFTLWRLPDHAGEVVHEARRPTTVLRGTAVPLEPGVLLLRSDLGPVSLREGGWLIDVDAGRVRAWAVPDAPPWPGLPALLGGRSCPAWLADRVQQRAERGTPLDRLAAAGLLARLWSPASPAERSQALGDLRAGRPQPATAIRAWLAEVSWAPVVEAAHTRAEQLIAAMDDLAVHGGSIELVAARDDLASLVAAMGLAGADRSELREALVHVDDAMTGQDMRLAELLDVDPDDPWLLAVLRHEPDHWWGALVR